MKAPRGWDKIDADHEGVVMKKVPLNKVFDVCHDCGADMLPDAAGGHPALPEYAGHPAGAIVDGEVWVRCTNGCRGGWRPANILMGGEL